MGESCQRLVIRVAVIPHMDTHTHSLKLGFHVWDRQVWALRAMPHAWRSGWGNCRMFVGFPGFCMVITLQPLQGFFKRVFQDVGWGVVPLISSSCALHGIVSRELHSFCRLGEPTCETVWVSWWCSSLRNPIQFLSGPSGLFGRLLPKSIEFWMTHTNLDFFHEFHRVSRFQRWSWMTACNAQSIFAFCIAWCSPISDISDIMPIPLSVWSAPQSFGT